MALVDVTIDFDLSQLLGSDFDSRRTKAYVTTNVESGTLMDTSTGETRLGDEAVAIASDGTGSFTTWAAGVDGNPISWQTSLVVDYPRTGHRDRKTRTFGPWTLTTADDGKNITELEDEQAIPAEYQTAFTDSMESIRDDAETAQAAAEAARDDAVDISGISTSDGVVEALVKNTGGAGPLTSAALSATIETGASATRKSWLQHTLVGGDEPGAFIAWTADDGYTFQTQHMFPALATRGIHGTLFVTKQWVGQAGTNGSWGDTYPTQAQVQALVTAGHELGEHGDDHTDKPSLIASLGMAGAEAKNNEVKAWIETTFGTTVRTGAYCAGLYTERSCELVARSFDFFRATRGATAYDAQNPFAVDSVPFDQLTEAQMKAKVDDALATRSLLVFSVHGVTPANYATVAAKIGAVADYATSLGIRQGSFYEGMSERTKRRGAAGSMEDALGNAFHRRVKAYRMGVQRDDVLAGRHWWEYNETDDSSYFDGDSGFFEFRKPLRIGSGTNFKLGQRSVYADGVLNSTTTVTSATAAFDQNDVGRTITGTGIPGGTTIASVTNPTTVVLSAAATATATGVTITLGRPTKPSAELAGDVFFYGNTRIRGSAPTLDFGNVAGTQTGSVSPTAWTNLGASGTGGAMLIDSGTGGSAVTVKAFSLGLTSQAGTSRMRWLTGTSTPTDASVATGEVVFWYDTTTGKPVPRWKGKDAAGTAFTGSMGRYDASATLDFPSIAAAGNQDLTVTVTGAAVGDPVSIGAPAAINAGLVWNGFVSAADTVTIRVSNITAAAIDPASATWKVSVLKP